MKKLAFSLLLAVFFSFLFLKPLPVLATGEYLIKNFTSQITLNQDTSLTVEEKIDTEFFVPRHGIIRIIPVIYSSGLKTIFAQIKVLSVTDKNGQQIPYKVDDYRQSLKITTGEAEKTLLGAQTYLIKYQIKRVVLTYQDHEEIYWNVTGAETDTQIEKTSAQVISQFAPIKKVECWAGQKGSQEKFCQNQFENNQAHFMATEPLGYGRDLTLVVALDKNNQLHFPSFWQKLGWGLKDNWGYLACFFPLIFLCLAWWRWGRDKRYLTDNVYYHPENKKEKTVSPFVRPHLPLVYHPIDGLTPAQVGTIFDEKVHLKDIIAEIVELGRLGYLKIAKIERKKFLGTKNDYRLTKIDKKIEKLTNYQKYLYEHLFENKNQVAISELAKKFYPHISKIRDLIYESLIRQRVFPQNPFVVRILWTVAVFFLAGLGFFLTLIYTGLTINPFPLLLFFPASIPAFILAQKMGRRTAWGYSLYRQTVGLRWYLDKGKWREEIAEKNLFFEEILPLAMVLGIVEKLAKDMAVLGIEPPKYFQGVAVGTFAHDFTSFNSLASSNLISSPSSSGRSSWSGGSGFSGGGSVGGGFGGGGTSSW